ncbi:MULTISPECIES: hypothetical protein [unclassified Bartonella]|uniref:hypothetical protein n=1 Tax=unclassified Bartonella TaxID=2645622 RepID=UPI0035D004A5
MFKPSLQKLIKDSLYAKYVPAFIQIPALGAIEEDTTKPIHEATLDDLAFAAQALDKEQSAIYKHLSVIRELYTEAQRQGHTQRLEEIQVQADVAESKALYAHASQPSGVKWVEALRASVRPIITYAFFILFATVKTAALFKLLDQGVGITDGLIALWDAETQALFAAVMSFWFDQRALAKFRSNP